MLSDQLAMSMTTTIHYWSTTQYINQSHVHSQNISPSEEGESTED